jgi:predicted membrane chloride channel (bestrophin family)
MRSCKHKRIPHGIALRRLFAVFLFSIAARLSCAAAFSIGHCAQTTAHTSVAGTTTVLHQQQRALLRPHLLLHANRAELTITEEDDAPQTRWLQWMTLGVPTRGTNKVTYREAAELGGVPRSDHYSSRDWWHNTITLPTSGILRDIRSPVLAATSWATFLSVLHRHLLRVHPQRATQLYLSSSAPHSLMMSALGLLLVFRTNSAYQRFAEGRKIWENIVNSARDLYRLLLLYETEIGLERVRRVLRLLAAFPFLLRHRIRPNLVMRRLDDDEVQREPKHTLYLYQDAGPKDMDYEAAEIAQQEEETGKSRRKTRPLFWVDKRTLPWRLLPKDALEKCARAQNRPLWVCDRMAKEIRMVPDSPSFSARERLTIIAEINKLSRSIGGAERIHQTVVPLNYARHTLRALTVWLFTLPFSIVKDLNLSTGPVIFIIAWLLFGVYEIGVRIEDPFQGTLRLSILCDCVRRDVLGDESIRRTAFELDSEVEDTEEDESEEDKDFVEAGKVLAAS